MSLTLHTTEIWCETDRLRWNEGQNTWDFPCRKALKYRTQIHTTQPLFTFDWDSYLLQFLSSKALGLVYLVLKILNLKLDAGSRRVGRLDASGVGGLVSAAGIQC